MVGYDNFDLITPFRTGLSWGKQVQDQKYRDELMDMRREESAQSQRERMIDRALQEQERASQLRAQQFRNETGRMQEERLGKAMADKERDEWMFQEGRLSGYGVQGPPTEEQASSAAYQGGVAEAMAERHRQKMLNEMYNQNYINREKAKPGPQGYSDIIVDEEGNIQIRRRVPEQHLGQRLVNPAAGAQVPTAPQTNQVPKVLYWNPANNSFDQGAE